MPPIEKQNTDVMVLSAAHSLMVSDVPEVVIDAQRVYVITDWSVCKS